jgi:ketosteroid isomerase-like protein
MIPAVALFFATTRQGCSFGPAGGIMRGMWRYLFSVVLLVLLGIASCGAPRVSSLGPKPTGSPPQAAARTPTTQPANDEEAIRQLIAAEGAAVVRQDIAGLMDLWANDAVIIDAKHTPDDASDDATWRGRDAVRSRYVVLVFPGNPQAAGARDVEVEMAADKANASSTTAIGSEVAQGGDRWTFVRRDGRWWIASLTYNLEE